MSASPPLTEDFSPPAWSADWSTSYSRFLSRASAQAADTLALYHEALVRVSQGKLEPAIFQNYLPIFIQTHGADYAKRLSELGATFLSRLVELTSAWSRHSFDSSASLSSEPEPVPPRFEAAGASLWFEQLADYAARLNSRALRLYRAELDRVASGERSPAEVQKSSTEYLSRELPQLLQQLTGLYYDLLDGLNELRAAYESDYFRGILALARQPQREPPVTVQLSAPRGETAFASLTVTNSTAARSRIRFTHTDARRLDGSGPAFNPALSVAPNSFELDPGAEQKVLLSLHLDEQHYDQAAPYTCTLYIAGSEAQRVEIALRIVATAPTHPATAPIAGS